MGRALLAWTQGEGSTPGRRGRGTICRKVSLGPGAELIVDERHPLFQSFDDDTIVDALRRAIDGLGDQREPQH